MKTLSRTLAAVAASALTLPVLALAAPGANASTRSAAAPSLGTRSLAAVLASDGNRFDRNRCDYDILDQAVGAVLKAKPKSPVAVLADGRVPLTAFLPNDRAFQVLAADLTGRWHRREADALNALAGKLGVNTIDAVLLYHVVQVRRSTRPPR